MKEFDIPEINSAWLTRELAELGLRYLTASALRVEASHRTFYRIETDQASVVLMMSPPELEANDRFVALSRAFASQQVAVPNILASEPTQGWFLLTDLGTTHLQQVYGTPRESSALSAAIHNISAIAATHDACMLKYTESLFITELKIFEEWFASAYLGLDLPITAESSPLLQALDMQPRCCVHLDYHCRNLLYDGQNIGVVDYQDARIGPILYDIASLLHDCYHSFDSLEIDTRLNEFLALSHTKSFSKAHQWPEIKRMFEFTAIQRQLKAVGIFARLSIRDHKQSHLPHIRPTLQRLLQLTSCHEELSNLHRLIEQAYNAYATSPVPANPNFSVAPT